MLQLSILGSFRAKVGEQLIEKFGSNKSKALLIYLAVEKHQIHHRESLMTMLWPGLPLRSAQQNLRQILYLLKKDIANCEMKVPFILAKRFTLAWNPAATLSLDVADFEKLTYSQNVADWQQAIDLYRGEYLQDFYLADSESFEEWVANKRAFYHHTALDVLDRLAAYYLRQRQWEPAETVVRRSLELDKLQEISHRRLIEILARNGHRQEALIHFNSLCQLLYEEMDLEPEPETKSLVAAIRAGELGEKVSLQINLGETARLVSETIQSPPRNNLPHALTSFIGRESDLTEIRGKLNKTDCRLLTLLGPGGYGKTRLAVEAAAKVLDNFKHGAFFVNLAPLQASNQILSTIAGAISFSFYGNGPPEEQLLDYLQNKEMLLILDNFEHLLDGACLVTDILNAAPSLKILTTSRVRLALIDEHLYNVSGMSYPEPAVSFEGAAQRYSAVRLFESQARQLQVDFELTDENLGDVIRICSLLEGMPLGIVLAASWVAMLSPAEIADEIAQDLAFLETDLRNLPERQRSLQSVFNHSWRLLSEREQQILAALSVFRGGFTRETAYAIAGASLVDLRGLLDKSMVQRSTNQRYEVHELLRQYAAEKLANNPSDEARIQKDHSSFFCQALAGWERDLQGPLQIVALQEMIVELDNIRIAWAWALEKTRIKTLLNALNGLCIFFNMLHRQRVEGQAVCQSLVEKFFAGTTKQPGASSHGRDSKNQIIHLKLQARALAWAGYFNAWLGNADLSRQMIQNCLSLIEGSELVNEDTRFEKALAYRMFPWVVNDAQQSQKIKIAEEAVQLFESLDEFWWVGSALLSLGFTLQSNSRAESIKVFERSLAICRKQQDLSGIALSLEILSNGKAQVCHLRKRKHWLMKL